MTTPDLAPAARVRRSGGRPGRAFAPSRLALVVGGAVLVALVRWWTSRQRVVFHMNPDEPGQLAMARFLGGGTRWDMFDHSTWRPGYAALISPITWFTDDPVLGIRAALVVNAVLGGVAFVLLVRLARRLTALSAAWCALAALVVSLAPTLLFTTDWVWSEALVQVTYLGCLLAVLRFVRGPSVGAGVGGRRPRRRRVRRPQPPGAAVAGRPRRRRGGLAAAAAVARPSRRPGRARRRARRRRVPRLELGRRPRVGRPVGHEHRGWRGRAPGQGDGDRRLDVRAGLVPARGDARAGRSRRPGPRPGGPPPPVVAGPDRRWARGTGGPTRTRPGSCWHGGAARRVVDRVHGRSVAARPARLRPVQRRRDGARGARRRRRRWSWSDGPGCGATWSSSSAPPSCRGSCCGCGATTTCGLPAPCGR